ncbi:MAG: hypothetical protein Q4P15_13450 [Propionibacteriaceae bacterium]|nr:hypothetical protein [Propionibacteriaceae bacterium]
MNKRVSLPGAAELFRTTQSNPTVVQPRRTRPTDDVPQSPSTPDAKTQLESPDPQPTQPPLASGRVRHDQKITVYFSSEELFALEDATLDCKRTHGLRVDRGRLVRSAVALALADLAERGEDSDVVAALRAQ